MRILIEVLRNLFRKPATRLFPKKKVKLPHGFRGKPVIDIDKCIFCGLCQHICPVEAIKIDRERKVVTLDLAECIFCAECMKKCPKKVIKESGQMLTAVETKQKLVAYAKA